MIIHAYLMPLLVAAVTMFAGCSSVSYVTSELGGSVKPEGGIKEVIPPSRTFQGLPSVIRDAVLGVLQETGYIYDENRSSGLIRTEPKPLAAVGGFAGATYSVRVFVNLDGQTVAYRARFDKQSNVTMGEQNAEYPEKENELRRDFFAAVQKRLTR